MNNKDKHFKGQYSSEKLVCFFRRHWITVFKDFAYFLVFLVIIRYTLPNIGEIKELLRGNREMKLLFFTGFLLGTIFLHRFFVHMFNFLLNIGLITNIRIIEHKKTLFFKDSKEAIRLGQIQDIERVREGLMASVLKFGDIKIYLNSSTIVKVFCNMPNPHFHFRCINRLIEERKKLAAQEREHKKINEIKEIGEISERDINYRKIQQMTSAIHRQDNLER